MKNTLLNNWFLNIFYYLFNETIKIKLEKTGQESREISEQDKTEKL